MIVLEWWLYIVFYIDIFRFIFKEFHMYQSSYMSSGGSNLKWWKDFELEQPWYYHQV